MLGKFIEQEWNTSPGMNKKFNGKVLSVKNSLKRGTKLIISYSTVEVTKMMELEDESITLVQFGTEVIHKDLVALV